MTKELLTQLNEQQRQAVTHTDGPLLIIAGAGSGKTRVITYRVAYLLSLAVPSWNILAVTFTNKAAEEMRVRVNTLLRSLTESQQQSSPLISTFHSFCVRVLRQDIHRLGYQRTFNIYDEGDSLRLIKQCGRELGLDEKKHRAKEILSVIDKAKDDLLDYESYQIYASASHTPFRLLVGDIYKRYQQKLKENNALDFGDLIMLTVQLWQAHPEVLQQYQERFKYIMIDEYQDTNHAQYILAKMLAAKYQNICAVGDEDQSIYMFRGADIRNILDFEKDYQKCTVIKLEQNYRSTQNILDTAHRVIENNKYRKEKKLWTENKRGEEVASFEFANEIEEASFVARNCQNLLQTGTRSSGLAVFYRTNAQSRVLEDAFRRFGLKYAVIGGMRFYERREVKDILAYLRALMNPADSLNLKRIINIPNRGIGDKTIEIIGNFAAEHGFSFYDALGSGENIQLLSERAKKSIQIFLAQLRRWREESVYLALGEITAKIIQESRYIEELRDGTAEAEERIGNVRELLSAVKEFEEQAEKNGLEEYLEQVALVSDLDSWKEEKNYITLMTLHLAKGLEFDTVFMTGMEEGILPHVNSLMAEVELEEERRICYVGMTRAQRRLILTCAAERRVNGVKRWNIPSRFMTEGGLVKGEEQMSDTRCQIPDRNQAKQITDNRWPMTDKSQTKQMPDTRYQMTDKSDERGKNWSTIDASGFRRKERILHEVFGEGVIIEVSGTGEDQKVVVDFVCGGRKKLLVKAANLRKL